MPSIIPTGQEMSCYQATVEPLSTLSVSVAGQRKWVDISFHHGWVMMNTAGYSNHID